MTLKLVRLSSVVTECLEASHDIQSTPTLVVPPEDPDTDALQAAIDRWDRAMDAMLGDPQ